jgi:hypothetical protein
MAAMLVRHRLAFLVGVLTATVALAVLRLAEIPVVSAVALGLLGLFWVGLALAPLIALNARQPQTFQVHAGAFTSAPPLGAIMSAGAFTAMSVTLAAESIDAARRGWHVDAVQVTVVVLLILLAPLQWGGVLRSSYGLFLRPDGLLDRQPLGSLFVPWEAGAAAEPTTYGVKLRVGRPDLIVKRGLRPGTAIRTGADRGFTAWAVNLYTARPDFRPAIGTLEGLRQLVPPPPDPA